MDYIKGLFSALWDHKFRVFLYTSSILVGGYSVYMMYQDLLKVRVKREMTKEEKLDKKLEKDMFMVGYITPNEDEILSLNDWDRIFRIVNKHNIDYS